LTDTPAPSSSAVPARRGLTEFWPSRAELELYRSDAVLSAEQNGVATGFSYRTTLASAGNAIARWSRYELPQLTADERADLHRLAPA
jgi:hypothetical protein